MEKKPQRIFSYMKNKQQRKINRVWKKILQKAYREPKKFSKNKIQQ